MNLNKKRRETIEQYKKWFHEKSEENEGLILQVTAARLLGTPRQNINRMIKIGKLKTYQFAEGYEIYVGLKEVEDILKKKIDFMSKNDSLAFSCDVTIMPLEKVKEWLDEWNKVLPEETLEEFITKKYKKWKIQNPTTAKEKEEYAKQRYTDKQKVKAISIQNENGKRSGLIALDGEFE
jgi:hypothetical protein